MSTSVFANTNLTEEAWRWQGGTVNTDEVAYNGALVDRDGNLFLVGLVYKVYRDGELTAADFGVYKLDGESGDVLWEWVDGAGSNTLNLGLAAAVDGDGNLIVGGSSTGSWTSLPNSDGGSDLAAVKLDGESGAELWRYQNIFATSSTTFIPHGNFCCRRRHRQAGDKLGAGSVDEIPNVPYRQYPLAAKVPSQEAHGGGNTTHPPAFGHTIYDVPRSQHEQRNTDVEGSTTVEELPEELPPPYTEVVIAGPEDDRPTPEGPPPRCGQTPLTMIWYNIFFGPQSHAPK